MRRQSEPPQTLVLQVVLISLLQEWRKNIRREIRGVEREIKGDRVSPMKRYQKLMLVLADLEKTEAKLVKECKQVATKVRQS